MTETARMVPMADVDIDCDFSVGYVLMPERGCFLVRAPETAMPGRWVTGLDYGEDAGRLISVRPFDPMLSGGRVPGFSLLRPFDPVSDGRREKENEKLAAAMRTTFLKQARAVHPDVAIVYDRLSLGRGRLFIRFTADVPKTDVSAAAADIERTFGIQVNARQLGPRDEVSVIGGLGPCGCVCCCHSWQQRYPAHPAPTGEETAAMLFNGTCNRFKCCLVFEGRPDVRTVKSEVSA